MAFDYKDLIMCYKIMHGHVALDLSDLFVLSNNSHTISHNFKLLEEQFFLDILFSNHIIDRGNNLPS